VAVLIGMLAPLVLLVLAFAAGVRALGSVRGGAAGAGAIFLSPATNIVGGIVATGVDGVVVIDEVANLLGVRNGLGRARRGADGLKGDVHARDDHTLLVVVHHRAENNLVNGHGGLDDVLLEGAGDQDARDRRALKIKNLY
jgi:hypothetical protein